MTILRLSSRFWCSFYDRWRVFGDRGDRIWAGFRNRVSSFNLGEDAKIVAETRFLGLSGRASETGFLHKIFVTMPKLSPKPGFLD
ncbi:hypothetical protein C7B69_06115 [filamentous cyanobacterium Phorm 46]|nr:hypothetical protein C7B69_06115 [filamentous cyanobacterium Phorm 46]PSB41158.1 hypothetical protein C7B67_27030 [filamentous cyanobacterium Phorm 6]